MVTVLILDPLPQRASGLAVLLRLLGHHAYTTRQTTAANLIRRSGEGGVILLRADSAANEWIVHTLAPVDAPCHAAEVIESALAEVDLRHLAAPTAPPPDRSPPPSRRLVSNPVMASRSPFTGMRRTLRAPQSV